MAQAPTPTPRRRLSAQERREGILEAALAVFSRRGYHPSSIDEIAQAAGISKALIYEHFDSKEQLHVSLIEMYAAELFERVAAAGAPGPDASERLEAGLDAVFAFVEERRGAWQMLFRETADPEAVAVLDRVAVGVGALVAELIAQDPGAQNAPDVERRDQAIAMIAQMIVGSTQALANWWNDHQDVPRERLVAIAMELLWPGLDRLREGPGLNFAQDVVGAADPSGTAIVALARDGSRSELTFGEVDDRAARLAGTLIERGVSTGDVVMTIVGNRPEWVDALLACWRIGAVALPCTEQLRPADLRARMDAVEPALVIADERDAATVRSAGFDGPVLEVPDPRLLESAPAPAAKLAATDPALIVFTSGTAGEPKPIRHGVRYLFGQAVQAEHWFGPRAGELAWCTAASGWSKSARNSFIAPWLRGAAALLHDARFDPAERLEVVEREGVDVLCMAPTEYRAIAKRVELRELPGLRHAVAAGEPLNPEVVHAWREGAGVDVHDGYGQTETGALTGMPLGEPVRPGSMGRALPGFHLSIEDGELCADPSTIPTFFLDGPPGTWRTGDRVREDEDGYLWFEGRTDDVIISAGYRIGPFEVESALVSHPAVAEAAAVGAPDEERGQVVRAVVVLRDGHDPGEALAAELQDHVKELTAPYKYPRVVEFADGLPKTASGKIKRAALRG